MNTEWYAEWFGKDYLEVYAHRNESEAKRHVDFLKEVVPDLSKHKILDIACGSGRHLAELEKQGISAIGIDRSEELLAHGKKLNPSLELIHADMRKLPFEDQSFSLVTNFFTSFGYFPSDEEHQLLLQEWRRVLKRDGKLFIDYLNKKLCH